MSDDKISDPLSDLVLTIGGDLSLLEAAFNDVALPTAQLLAGLDASTAAAGTLANSIGTISTGNLKRADLSVPSVTLRPEVFDALLPANHPGPQQQNRLARRIKYELNSGNWLTITIDHHGEVSQHYASAPTKADRAAAKHCLVDALTDAGLKNVRPRRDGEASRSGPEITKGRAKIRSKWFDEQLAATKENWSSAVDVENNGGPSYKTIRRWLRGEKSTRGPYVRRKLADAFRCSLRDVPK